MFSVIMQRRKFDRFDNRPRTWLAHGSRAECKVRFACAAGRNGHFHLLFGAVGSAFMPRYHGVLAWRHAADRVAAVRSTDRKERVLRYGDVRLHPWMLVALHRNEYFRAGQFMGQRRSAVRLRL